MFFTARVSSNPESSSSRFSCKRYNQMVTTRVWVSSCKTMDEVRLERHGDAQDPDNPRPGNQIEET
jgi:hypothetical protein